MVNEHEATVKRLLDAAGIEPPDDEVAAMIESYPALRAAADSLYTPDAAPFVPAFLTTDTAALDPNAGSR